MPEPCQVDFYVLEHADDSPEQLACMLTLKAWKQGHRVAVLTEDAASADALDDLMWESPPGRFLPHSLGGDESPAPILIHSRQRVGDLGSDLVINLTAKAIDSPGRFRRVLEIVPADDRQRAASRDKFRAYRNQGLSPESHSIGKSS